MQGIVLVILLGVAVLVEREREETATVCVAKECSILRCLAMKLWRVKGRLLELYIEGHQRCNDAIVTKIMLLVLRNAGDLDEVSWVDTPRNRGFHRRYVVILDELREAFLSHITHSLSSCPDSEYIENIKYIAPGHCRFAV